MMLVQSLKELEAAGMVHRKQYNEVPPRVEYSLTELGESIVNPLTQLVEWGLKQLDELRLQGIL
jgi:DNA-binding HxlR family transcriptional regulator